MPKLTKQFVDSLSPENGDQIIFDDGLPGFGVRVKPSGVKSWVIRYRAGRRNRSLTLGKCSVLTPDEARREAKIRLGEISRGADPSTERKENRKAPTVAELAEDYLNRHAIPNKRPRSVADDKSLLDRFVSPAMAKKRVKDITRRDIEKLKLSLADRPYQANRLHALLSKMFALAVAWEWRERNPVTGIPKNPERARERWLSTEELKRLFAVLDEQENQTAANIIRFLVLTGARRGEVLAAEWSEIDFARAVWTKPSHHTKQKRTEHVPLSAGAIALLEAQRAVSGNKRSIFPRPGLDEPYQEIRVFWKRVRAAAQLDDVRLHDLRHTFASHLVSQGMSLPIVGRLLGHTQTETTKRYAHLADNPLREAADRMANVLDQAH